LTDAPEPGDSLEEVDKKHVIKKIRNNGMLSSFHFFITVYMSLSFPGLHALC
jgi:hypothetical protein